MSHCSTCIWKSTVFDLIPFSRHMTEPTKWLCAKRRLRSSQSFCWFCHAAAHFSNLANFVFAAPFENQDDLHNDNLKSFKPVMLLVPRPPLNKLWENFLDEVRKRNSEKPIYGLRPSLGGVENVRNFRPQFIRVSLYKQFKTCGPSLYERWLMARGITSFLDESVHYIDVHILLLSRYYHTDRVKRIWYL